MKCPAEVYQPSTRLYTGLPGIDYPFHDKTIMVTRSGHMSRPEENQFSQVYAGQAVAIREVHDDIRLVSAAINARAKALPGEWEFRDWSHQNRAGQHRSRQSPFRHR